jgi:hypothetical protein
MRSFSLAIVGLLALVSSTTASFHWDVVGRTETVLRQQRALNDQLLEKAIPVKDFEAKYGVSLNRQLEENNYENFDYNNMYSFDGFSLTYAKCQPVQYFSENAVEEGNSSPMVVDDIVVLRLCPTKSCSDTKEYGCYTNFAEYAVELKDYLYVMLNFEVTKVQYMCNYCQECLNGYGGRQLEEEQQQQQQQNDYNNGNEDNQQEQDGENAYDQEQQQQQQEEQFDQYYEDFGYDDQVNYDNACSGWDTYCSDYGDICVRNNNGGDGQENKADGNGYLSYRGYLDYLECNQAENKNGAMYFIKPRCDGTHNTIKMMAHYDANCYNSISEMSIRNFGLGMKDSAFQSFYSGECVACEESVSSITMEVDSSRHAKIHLFLTNLRMNCSSPFYSNIPRTMQPTSCVT